jgi:hypothetical protein
MEIVRTFNAPHEGQNVVPVIREMVERLGPDPQPDAVLAEWGEDPGYQNLHPEFELDVSAAGAFGTVARGPREVMLSWARWIEAWESYVYRTVEYRDIGDWVLQTVDVRARGRGDIPVEMRTFQVWQVRDGTGRIPGVPVRAGRPRSRGAVGARRRPLVAREPFLRGAVVEPRPKMPQKTLRDEHSLHREHRVVGGGVGVPYES